MNFFARVRHITRPLSNLETGVISQKKFSFRAFASQLPRNFLLHADRKRLPPTTSESWWRHALYYLRFNARNFNNIILSCVQLRVTRIPFRIIASPSPPPFLLSFRNFVISEESSIDIQRKDSRKDFIFQIIHVCYIVLNIIGIVFYRNCINCNFGEWYKLLKIDLLYECAC